jgi:hypothetical protein
MLRRIERIASGNHCSIWIVDKLLEAPISQYAASHSALPDEEYELAERMYAESDRRLDAQQRFNSLLETEYLN